MPSCKSEETDLFSVAVSAPWNSMPLKLANFAKSLKNCLFQQTLWSRIDYDLFLAIKLNLCLTVVQFVLFFLNLLLISNVYSYVLILVHNTYPEFPLCLR